MVKLSGQIFKQILLAIHEKFSELIRTTLKRDINSFTEQTVLASVVIFWESNCSFEIISIGSGTKSVGCKNLSLLGNLIADSHAEVLARRGFKRFIIDNLHNDKYFFKNTNGKLQQRDFKVIFYSSQTPCGQASIGRTCMVEENCQEKQVNEGANDGGQCNATVEQQQDSKTKKEQEIFEQQQQKLILQSTGAKYYDFVFDEKYNPTKDAEDNQLRVKPGRSDLPRDARSISLSCSDKILFWNILGLQGSLLLQELSAPIYIDYLFIEGEGNTKNSTQQFKQGIKHGLFLEERLSGQFTRKQIKQRVFQNNQQQNDEIEGKNKVDLLRSSKKISKQLVSSAFKLSKPKVIVTKKIFFTLNRSLVDRKPKYLDQHIIYVASAVITGERKTNVVEVLNGVTGLKWGMGAKGAEVPKNYPFVCKYCMIQAFNEERKINQVNQYSQEKDESLAVKVGQQFEGLNQEQVKDSQEDQEKVKIISYGEQKMQAKEYHTIKNQIQGLFRDENLVSKSYLEKFVLSNSAKKK